MQSHGKRLMPYKLRLSWLAIALAVCVSPWISCSQRKDKLSELLRKPEFEPLDPNTANLSPEVKALANRLNEVSKEADDIANKRVRVSPNFFYRSSIQAAHINIDRDSPGCVREVIMSVKHVDWDFWVFDHFDREGFLKEARDTPVMDKDLLLLKPFASTIKRLDLQQTLITDDGLQTVAELTALETLNLAGTELCGGGLAHLKPLPKLQNLSLKETTVGSQELECLSAILALKYVAMSASSTSDEVVEALSRLPNLERIDLADSSITDRGLKSLARLKKLTRLDLSRTRITDEGLQYLANLKNLTDLNLTQTKITNDGLLSIGRVTSLTSLNLMGTSIDDSGLAYLSTLKNIESIQLEQTNVRGHGIARLQKCGNLSYVSLPPIEPSALWAINSVKSWKGLSIQLLRASEDSSANNSPILSDMPNLVGLDIEQISSEPEEKDSKIGLNNLPNLERLTLNTSFQQAVEIRNTKNLEFLDITGVISNELLRSIQYCSKLERLTMHATKISDELKLRDNAADFSKMDVADITIDAEDGGQLIALIGKMPNLRELKLRGKGLKEKYLAPLAHCVRINKMTIQGIDDAGTPLAFLNTMPSLYECYIGNSPQVGRFYLDQRSGLQKLSFGSVRLDELEVDGPSNLVTIDVGEAKTDIGRIIIRNLPKLNRLWVYGQSSTIPFTEIDVANCAAVENFKVYGPPRDFQNVPCRLSTSGQFMHIRERRLMNLTTRQEDIDRLMASKMFATDLVQDISVE